MDCDIYDKVTNFYELLNKDKNHRYKSWEHCYRHFMDVNASSNVKVSCLHLSFYLASWGMYRGSSFLLWKDYLIHEAVVEELLKYRKLQSLDFSSIDDADLEKIIGLAEWIKKWYCEKIEKINGKSKLVNATDTLVTKIMLGTIGCIPAYDRYFIDGMRKSGIKYSKLSKKNLKAVSEYYQKNESEFIKAQKSIRKTSKCEFDYPAMKLVDMYFWEIGFQIEQRKKLLAMRKKKSPRSIK